MVRKIVKKRLRGLLSIYLVDTDIHLDNRPKSLLTVVYWFSIHLFTIENKLKTILPMARNNIKQFIDEYQILFPNLEDKNLRRLLEIQKFLSGKEFGDTILPAIPIFEKK